MTNLEQQAIRTPSQSSTSLFEDLANKALLAMEAKALELKIEGVAVVAYVPGEKVTSWTSKMQVVESLAKPATEKENAANFLGIAYTKAAEMARLLCDSGENTIEGVQINGEYGWRGGVMARSATGLLFAAFSGGPSEDDVKVSRAGLEILKSAL